MNPHNPQFWQVDSETVQSTWFLCSDPGDQDLSAALAWLQEFWFVPEALHKLLFRHEYFGRVLCSYAVLKIEIKCVKFKKILFSISQVSVEFIW